MNKDINSINTISDSSDDEMHEPQEGKSLNEDLINVKTTNYSSTNKKTNFCIDYCSKVFPCLKSVDTTSKRYIYFNNPELNITNWSNQEENNKYNLITFVPVVLFNQFKQFGNFFYLIPGIKSRIFVHIYITFSFCCCCFNGKRII